MTTAAEELARKLEELSERVSAIEAVLSEPVPDPLEQSTERLRLKVKGGREALKRLRKAG